MVHKATHRSSRNGISQERLLAAAAELFASRGYRATTLDDIAAAVDIKKASLYHYIRSKEELLSAIYDRIFDRITAAVQPLAAARGLAADERLRRMLHAHVEVVAAESAMLAVVFQEEAQLSQARRVVIRQRKRDYEQIFEGVIVEGQRVGVLRALSPRLMVRALMGMCNWLYQWYRPDRDDWQQIAAELTLLIESGWLSGEGEDQRRGAWARAESVDAALASTRDAVRRARAELDAVGVEIARAANRLQDGLA